MKNKLCETIKYSPLQPRVVNFFSKSSVYGESTVTSSEYTETIKISNQTDLSLCKTDTRHSHHKSPLFQMVGIIRGI